VPSLIACIVLAAALAVGLAACGDSEESDDSTQTLTFTLTGSGKASSFTAPKSADPGLAEIKLVNGSKKEGELQLVRVEGEHSDTAVASGLKNAIEGKAIPDWFFAGGGLGPVPPGQIGTVTQVLEPGTYYAYNAESGSVKTRFTVKGKPSDEALEADATVTAIDYGFETDELPSGRTEIAFDNTGAQPHHLLVAPLIDESTAKDVEEYFKTEKGKAPLDQKETQATAVIEGGEGQLVTLDLKPGRYVLYCFISDRQGGPPHALKGMVDEVEVK
jgi:hypothetical protein